MKKGKVGQSTQLHSTKCTNEILDKICDKERSYGKRRVPRQAALDIKSLYFCYEKTSQDISVLLNIEIEEVDNVISGEQWSGLKPRYTHGKRYIRHQK